MTWVDLCVGGDFTREGGDFTRDVGRSRIQDFEKDSPKSHRRIASAVDVAADTSTTCFAQCENIMNNI